jgi:hypothetical protein
MAFIPFAATVGSWMGASAATAAAVGGTAIASVAAAGGAAALSMQSGKNTPSYTAPVTDVQSQSKILDEEKKKLRKGKTSRSTLMTGPQGLLEAAPVSRKSLLGE